MDDDLLKEICRCVDHHHCPHPGFVGFICTRCGSPTPECGDPLTLPFNYIRPDLTLTISEVNRLRDINLQSLIRRKKLHLMLDLDNTLIHTAKSETLTLEEKAHLRSNHSVFEVCGGVGVVKIRPGVREFLQEASAMFEMSVYTMGSRKYAEEVARVLDPEGWRFGERRWRVMSSEDCIMKEKKSLDYVLSHERVVLIVDDQEKAWGRSHKGNIVKIKPYKFFTEEKEEGDRNRVLNKLLGETWRCSYRFREDVEKEKKELARVLVTLRKVYNIFYSYSNGNGYEREFRDVRRILKRVEKSDDDDGFWLLRLMMCLNFDLSKRCGGKY